MNRTMRSLGLACAILTIATGVNAATKCQIGVKAGMAIQELDGDDVTDNVGSRTGFVGGGYFQADFSKSLGVRVEGLYFMKGASADSAGIEATVKLDYIEFPVLLVANIPVSETARLSVFGGPTFGFNSKAEVEASAFGLSGTLDIGDAVKSFEFGLTFGAGLSFDVGSVILGLDGRYGFSMSTIADEDFVDQSGATNVGTDADVKNQGFAFMASLGFPIGEK